MKKTYATPAVISSADVVRNTLSMKNPGSESDVPAKDPNGAAVGFYL